MKKTCFFVWLFLCLLAVLFKELNNGINLIDLWFIAGIDLLGRPVLLMVILAIGQTAEHVLIFWILIWMGEKIWLMYWLKYPNKQVPMESLFSIYIPFILPVLLLYTFTGPLGQLTIGCYVALWSILPLGFVIYGKLMQAHMLPIIHAMHGLNWNWWIRVKIVSGLEKKSLKHLRNWMVFDITITLVGLDLLGIIHYADVLGWASLLNAMDIYANNIGWICYWLFFVLFHLGIFLIDDFSIKTS